MTRARTLADLAGQSLATDAELASAIAASGKYGSGYTDAVATAASGDPTSVTINRAVRVVNNTEHEFTNLTFNMPSNANTDTSDWTDPGAGTYKWSYVYIRPSDEKFYLSNNAPATGQNYRTIGGDDVVYLFPIWSQSTTLFRFQLTSATYLIQQHNAQRGYSSGGRVPGLRMIYSTNLPVNSGTSYNYNLSSYFPATASLAFTQFSATWGQRRDSPAMGEAAAYIYAVDDSGTERLLAYGKNSEWLDTPTVNGGYYINADLANSEFWISPKIYDMSQVRVYWFQEIGHSDGNTNFGYSLHSFVDANIF